VQQGFRRCECCHQHRHQCTVLCVAAVCLSLQFKLLMNWNQEELDQWSVAQQQKEEDNQALDKYR
jgi:hypothetical protein